MLKEKGCQVSFCFSAYTKQPMFLRHSFSKLLEFKENKYLNKPYKSSHRQFISVNSFKH